MPDPAQPDACTDFSDPRNSIVHRGRKKPGPRGQLGPYNIESLIEPDEERAATAYRVIISPYKTTAVSFHKEAEEFYYIITGGGKAILNGKEFVLQEGDFLRLPPGTTHGFVTESEPLEMLNMHTPGSRPNRDVFFPYESPPEGFSKNKL